VTGTRVSPEVVEYPDLKQVTAQSRHPSTTGGELFLIHDVGGKGVTEREETGIELLLSEPEIVAWLEPHENKDDDDADEPPRAA